MSIIAFLSWVRHRLDTSSERGAGMVEYGLLVGLIAIIALVAVQTFGSGVSTQFSSINSAVN